MCEWVYLNNDFPIGCDVYGTSYDIRQADEDGEEGSMVQFSPEKLREMGHRRRSNTAQRLEKLKKEKRQAAKCRNVTWRERHMNLTEEKLSELFTEKELETPMEPIGNKVVSCFSELLKITPSMPTNPFAQYAKFDGNSNVGVPIKRININLTALPKSQQTKPLPVSVVASARVSDLIGLVCYLYTNENLQPPLISRAEAYSLFMADEDGTVDLDLPCLNPRDNISKFLFSVLALVENPDRGIHGEKKFVHVNMPDDSSVDIELSSECETAEGLVKQGLKRAKLLSKYRVSDVQLYKKSDPNVPLSHDTRMSSVDDRELVIRRKSEATATDGCLTQELLIIDAPRYECFRVSQVHKIMSSTEVQMGISGEKIEIVPAQASMASKLLSKPTKLISYDMNNVADCILIEERYNCAYFRFIFSDGEGNFKTYDFEGDKDIVKMIVEKCHNILELHPSQVRQEYLAIKETRSNRKKAKK
ncbi:unnamed protein product [Darwinula stevensoni]|uniref:Target of rapamycin complex 2 subunit MAPKAP1 n=1 Tax=Darwinula stevensoni TaxID=69355 RepID=A0A7R8X759_9CRUS|nr:unnamed protein product [Darwinula stevensoni]CAG0888845.1 unnamed protein product [Darwinula stevensoni]